MTTDLELETWQREWREHTEPLPELKKKIRRQNLRTLASVIAIALCFAVSTTWALTTRSSFLFGVATGIAVTSMVVGLYAWRVRRGSWKPTAQTTLAYAELSHKRAVAKTRTLRFMFYFLLVAVVLYTGFFAWNWQHFNLRDGVILVALIVELLFLKRSQKRKRVEVAETQALLDDLNQQ